MHLSPAFDAALTYAIHIHAFQKRKDTEIPYIAHLLAVSSIVLEHGGSEAEAIGALLHDAGEDAGGAARVEDIRVRFGDAVAQIVADCTDTYDDPKPPWRPRKEAYLASIPHKAAGSRLVSCADKVHNARSILRDHRRIGDAIFRRFSASKADTLWYYDELTRAFLQATPRSEGATELAQELDRIVTELHDCANHPRK
jgi:(p)ppGpp synthase/HD superfamily hydrolase